MEAPHHISEKVANAPSTAIAAGKYMAWTAPHFPMGKGQEGGEGDPLSALRGSAACHPS